MFVSNLSCTLNHCSSRSSLASMLVFLAILFPVASLTVCGFSKGLTEYAIEFSQFARLAEQLVSHIVTKNGIS